MRKNIFENSTLRFVALIGILVLCWYAGRYFEIDTAFYKSWLLQFPLFISGLIFVLLYVGVTFFAWLAKDLFKIIGAFVFGAYLSTFLIWIAEMFNAAILFHLSRNLGRGFVESKLKRKEGGLNRKIEGSGFWGIFALRAVPLIPYRFLDLACGLTKISFAKYFLIVVVGSPPRIFWIQFILAGIGEAFLKDPNALTKYLMENNAVFLWSFLYVIAAIVIVIRWNKKG